MPTLVVTPTCVCVCVSQVGEFKQLALRAEHDSQLRQRLQHVLKLSKEKWEEAREHAMRAVVADGRVRLWRPGASHVRPNQGSHSGAECDSVCEDVYGVLFTCRLGAVELDKPMALVQFKVRYIHTHTHIHTTLCLPRSGTLLGWSARNT